MATRKSPVQVNRPSAKMQWDLTNLVKDNYASRQQNDIEFAKWAAEQLGFPVTKHNIEGARETLEIPSTAVIHKAQRYTANGDSNLRLRMLEVRLTALEQRVQVYIDGCQRDPRSPRSTQAPLAFETLSKA